jgi:tRNA pseudouridine13 synthase
MSRPALTAEHPELFPDVFVTPEVEPLGGVIKQRDEDFLVEEIPQYDPCGEGEHIYLLVEKRGLSTSEMVDVIRRHFRVRESAIGYAGMKDKHAITRQVVSIHVPGRKLEDFPELRHERVGVLWTDMHTNKLRLGHLRGNRFSIRIRDVEATSVVRAHEVVRLLGSRGVPNIFGVQRFGVQMNNHELGRLLLLGDDQGLLDVFLGPIADQTIAAVDQNAEGRALYVRGEFAEALRHFQPQMRNERTALRALAEGAGPPEAVRAVHPVQLRFWVSAFQSALFNMVVTRRLQEGSFDKLLPGDVATKLRNNAQFDIDEETLADPETARRLESFEISPSGPIWGPKTKLASGDVGTMERAVLARTGVTVEAITDAAGEHGISIPGTRRAMRIPLTDPEIEGGVDDHGHYVRVAFELPPGSFATVVMREIMKTPMTQPADGDASES